MRSQVRTREILSSNWRSITNPNMGSHSILWHHKFEPTNRVRTYLTQPSPGAHIPEAQQNLSTKFGSPQMPRISSIKSGLSSALDTGPVRAKGRPSSEVIGADKLCHPALGLNCWIRADLRGYRSHWPRPWQHRRHCLRLTSLCHTAGASFTVSCPLASHFRTARSCH